MYSLSMQAGEMDFNDDHKVKQFEADFKALMKDLKEHAENEEFFILPLLKSRFPEKAAIFEHDHPELSLQVEKLLEMLQTLAESINCDRTGLSLIFYRAFNKFIGEYVLHLEREETGLLPVFDAHYSQEELIGVMIAFKTFREGKNPDQVKQFIKAMIGSLNTDSVKKVFLSMKKHAPKDLFNPICDLVRDVVEPALWAQLEICI